MSLEEIFILIPYGFGVGFAIETLLSLFGFGIRKALSLFNFRA